MSTIKSIRPEPEGVVEQPQARISLQPIAPPSILGLYGFAGATFMVAAHMAHWFGTAQTDLVLFPLRGVLRRTGTVSGRHVVVQGARRGSYRHARYVGRILDGLRIVDGAGVCRQSGDSAERWGVSRAGILVHRLWPAITWAGMVAAAAESSVVATVLGFLAAGSTIAAIANLNGIEGLSVLAGYLFIISAVIAWYAATALMVNAVYGRVVMGLGSKRSGAPGIQAGIGEPGVLHGQ